MALRGSRSLHRPPRQRNTAQSCSSGCGSITGGMPTGRAGWLCPPSPSPSLLRGVSLRRGQVPRRLVHLRRPPELGSRLLTRWTGTVTRIPSVTPRPTLTQVPPARSRPQLLMPGQPSSRTGFHLSQVRGSVCQWVAVVVGRTRPKRCSGCRYAWALFIVYRSDGKQAYSTVSCPVETSLYTFSHTKVLLNALFSW